MTEDAMPDRRWSPRSKTVIFLTATQRMCDIRNFMLIAIFLLALAQDVEKMIDRDPVVRVLPRDAIPAIDAPAFESAEAAARFMRDDEIVIGVTDGKEARAYSTWLLDTHEIVNDVIGSTPIAVTW